MSGSAPRGAASLALLLAVLFGGHARADDIVPRDTTALDGLRIGRVEIVAHDVYEPVPPGRLGPLYRLSNQLHVRTRDEVIRPSGYFEPGGREAPQANAAPSPGDRWI